MSEINITFADMTAAELRAAACSLLEQMTDTQIRTLYSAILNELHEIEKRSASHE